MAFSWVVAGCRAKGWGGAEPQVHNQAEGGCSPDQVKNPGNRRHETLQRCRYPEALPRDGFEVGSGWLRIVLFHDVQCSSICLHAAPAIDQPDCNSLASAPGDGTHLPKGILAPKLTSLVIGRPMLAALHDY